jgi:hypothetical protein
MPGKEALRQEVAALAETVRELRTEVATLRIERASVHSCGCHCGHVCFQVTPYVPVTYPLIMPPYQITCSGGTNVSPAVPVVSIN